MKKIAPLAVAYVGLAVLANWLASRYVWPVGFGLLAPGGVFVVGGVLVLRDWLNQINPRASVALIPVASLISYGVGEAAGWSALQKIALASVAAFVVSESVEWLVFAPLRKRSLTLGVALSGSVGIALDSYVFLTLAFGSLAFFDGQMVGKAEALGAGVVLTAARRRFAPVPGGSMKIAASGWIYDVPPETEFIEVTPMDGERAFVACFDAAGDALPRLSGDLLSNVAPVQPWPKRVAA